MQCTSPVTPETRLLEYFFHAKSAALSMTGCWDLLEIDHFLEMAAFCIRHFFIIACFIFCRIPKQLSEKVFAKSMQKAEETKENEEKGKTKNQIREGK